VYLIDLPPKHDNEGLTANIYIFLQYHLILNELKTAQFSESL
jgi:hypothetical protein